MDRLWLDYQRPVPGRQRPGMLLLGAAIAVSVWIGFRYTGATTRVEEVRAQVSRLKRDAARQTLLERGGVVSGREAATTGAADDGRSAANVLAERWESLLAALEAAAGESVTLLSVQPDAGEVRLGGEAGSVDGATAYVKRLQAAREFEAVYLTQSEIVRTHPQTPVRFSAVAQRKVAPR